MFIHVFLQPIMAPKALLVCLLIVAVAFVEAGKHPKANKIKKGKLFMIFFYLELAMLVARLTNHCKKKAKRGRWKEFQANHLI